MWGCTPWWAQLSVCMKIPLVTFREAFENSFWFKDTEEKCLDFCQIRNSPNMCMECWMKSISASKVAFDIFCGINEGLCETKDAKKYFVESASSCLRKYIPAHVDETPPMMKQANLKSIGRVKSSQVNASSSPAHWLTRLVFGLNRRKGLITWKIIDF